jgi:redox-sensitive bicupin YhaK (pirin superfamily)
MIDIRTHDSFGQTNIDWLQSRHHFSFGDYMRRDRMSFGPLRVVNDDWVKAGSGFPLHPHSDMEIITYVTDGAVHHKDNLGNSGTTPAGTIQVMSAGTGIAHAEYADAGTDTHLFQIWLRPSQRGLAPRWAQRPLTDIVPNRFAVLASGRDADLINNDVMRIYQDAALIAGRFDAGTPITHALNGPVYLVVAKGSFTLAGGQALNQGDAAAISDETLLQGVCGTDGAELLLLDLPAPQA